MRVFLISLVSLIIVGSAVEALERVKKIQSSGNWRTYVVENVKYPDRSGSLKKACSAGTASNGATLDLVFDSKFMILRATSANWKLKSRNSKFKIGTTDGKVELNFGNAGYRGDSITFMAERDQSGQVLGALLAGFTRGPLYLFDRKGRPIAKFSGKGFKKTLSQTLGCADSL